MPLIHGHYPQTNPLWALTGDLTNVANPSLPHRSNLEFTGLGNPSDGALAATGVGCFVPVPVEAGAIISKVGILVGATAGAVLTHQFAAIYSGIATPALLGQSTDTTSAAIPASAYASWSLSSPVQITQAQAPQGFIYAGIVIVGSTIPTALSIAIPTAVGYQWFTGGPLFLSATAGSGLLATAAATIASPAAKAVAPAVFLT